MHLSFLLLALAAEAEVQESEPARLTPPLYRVQHPLVQFTGGGRLISLMSDEDEEEQPKCVIASVQVSIVYGVNVSFKNSNANLEDEEFQLNSKLNLFYTVTYFRNHHAFLSVQMVFSVKEMEIITAFPGPLSRYVTL